MSYKEGNHYACHHANLLTFENTVNKSRIRFIYSITQNKCLGTEWNSPFINSFSHIINESKDLLKKKYGINNFEENDIDAIYSRIDFVQRHVEIPSRWDKWR